MIPIKRARAESDVPVALNILDNTYKHRILDTHWHLRPFVALVLQLSGRRFFKKTRGGYGPFSLSTIMDSF